MKTEAQLNLEWCNDKNRKFSRYIDFLFDKINANEKRDAEIKEVLTTNNWWEVKPEIQIGFVAFVELKKLAVERVDFHNACLWWVELGWRIKFALSLLEGELEK